MNCAKCGREIEKDQVFCPVCLEEMERHPVKPGTVVYIPKHFDEEVEKKPYVRRKLPPTPEQQIKKLKRKVTWLRILLILSLLVSGALSLIAGQMVTELDFYRFLGQNYSTIGDLDGGTSASTITTTNP